MIPKPYLYGGIALAVVIVIAAIYYEGKGAGGKSVELKLERANNDATKRKGAVKPADSVGTIERLQSGTF